ncbi:hypothetical protein IWZ03DRAFT_382331 [Phyllosticta citriasiana]|uniref:Secreted protein n=1 Tax=Phyllosticta citriasiana TaxID=595635 RepID=A0ABR1KI84_9PEZI
MQSASVHLALIRLLTLPLRLVRTTASPSFSEANTQYVSAAQSNLAHWSIHGIGPICHLSGCALATQPGLGTPRRRARSLMQKNREDTSTTDPGRARCLCIGLPVGCWCPGHVVCPLGLREQRPVPAVLHNLSGSCSPACTPPSVLRARRLATRESKQRDGLSAVWWRRSESVAHSSLVAQAPRVVRPRASRTSNCSRHRCNPTF